MINITPIPAFNDNYIWIISHANSRQAIVVDPGIANDTLQHLDQKKYKLAGVLVTHHHADHTGGIAELIEKHPAPVYGPAKDSVPTCSYPLKEGDKIDFPEMELSFNVLDVPGHTKGHIAFYGNNMLFCGDTLFAAGCGRVFEGTMAQMAQSLKKLSALPSQTKVYCAHEYTANNLAFAVTVEPNNEHIHKRIKETQHLRKNNMPTVPSTLELELTTNPFLRCDAPDVIKAAESHANQKLHNNPVDVFKELREWKDAF